MNKYRLDKRPTKYYLDQFDVTKIQILPYREEGCYDVKNGEWKKIDRDKKQKGYYFPERKRQGIFTIQYGEDDLDIEVYFPVNGEDIEPKYLELINDVLSRVTELDSTARSIPSDFDHGEYLAYINIAENEVKLGYFATTVNTNWETIFKKQPDDTWKLVALGTKRFDD